MMRNCFKFDSEVLILEA